MIARLLHSFRIRMSTMRMIKPILFVACAVALIGMALITFLSFQTMFREKQADIRTNLYQELELSSDKVFAVIKRQVERTQSQVPELVVEVGPKRSTIISGNQSIFSGEGISRTDLNLSSGLELAIFARNGSAWAVRLISANIDQKTQRFGYFRFHIDTEELKRSVSRSKEAKIMIINRSGQVILSTFNFASREEMWSRPILKFFVKNQASQGMIESGRLSKQIALYREIFGSNLLIFVETDTTRMYRSILASLRKVILLIGAILIAIILVLGGLLYSISNGLDDAIRGLSALRQGLRFEVPRGFLFKELRGTLDQIELLSLDVAAKQKAAEEAARSAAVETSSEEIASVETQE